MKRRFWLLLWLISATFLVVDVSEVRPQFFRTRPQDSFVSEGDRAIISCVIGNLAGRVQWTKDGLTLGYNRILPGYKRHSVVGSDESGVYNLQILNATISDDATYECQVGPNGTQKAIRAEAKLNVLLPPTRAELLNHPPGSVLEVKEGKEVALTCRVYNSKPRPDIMWYKGVQEFTKALREDTDEPGSLTERITVTSTIRFKPTFSFNDETIACEAQHPALHEGPLRMSVSLSIQYPPGPPEIEGYEEGQVLKTGDTVSLVCISRGGNPLAMITWYKNGMRVDSSYTTSPKHYSTNTYTFVAKRSDNKAKYTCMAKNSFIKKELLAEVVTTVQFAPENVKISGPSEAKAGDVLHFQCVTSPSNPIADVWWVVDGRSVKPNNTRTVRSPDGGWSTSSNISVNVETRDTIKIIQCHAVNQELGETRVESHTVSILYPPGSPKILGYKDGEVIPGGQTHKIRCTSHGGNPLATVAWYHNNREVESEYELGDMDATATLVLSANMTDNGATYRCVVSNKASSKLQEIKIKLKVNFAPSFVRIDVSPKRPRSGGMAELTCHSGEANPQATIEWLFNGERLSGYQSTQPGSYGGKKSINVLKLDMDSSFDGRVFTCKAINKIGEAVDAITLSVAYKPTFPKIMDPIEIIEGLPRLVNVTAKANPRQLSYNWTNPAGVRITSLPTEGIWVSRGVLNITSASREMAGTYTVTTNNTEGMATTKIKLDVLYSPRITDISRYVMVGSGDAARLRCSINANPVKYEGIRWEREDDEGRLNLFDDGMDGVSIAVAGSGDNNITTSLNMQNVSALKGGRIWCVASNDIGEEARRETYLLVKHKPVMDKSPRLLKAAARSRDTGRLMCRAKGAPNITFTWRRQTGELAVGSKYNKYSKMVDPLTWESTFEVLDVNQADYGVYECLARNTEGTARHQVMLDAPSAPDPPSHIKVINVTSNSIQLTWNYGFNGGSDQYFRVRYTNQDNTGQNEATIFSEVHPINSSVYTFAGLKANTKYSFAVRSLNEMGESPWVSLSTLVTTNRGRTQSNQPLVDGLIDTTSQTMTGMIVTIAVGVCGTLLLLLSVVLISCIIHKKRQKAVASQSISSDGSKLAAPENGFICSGSQASGNSLPTSCYNDTMSEETLSSISERSVSYISSPQEVALRNLGLPNFLNEGYHPHAASTYLTEHEGGIYSVEKGRQLSGFTSRNLPLNVTHVHPESNWEDTESQYADELRRQAYLKTLASPDLIQFQGEGYNISQIGSSVSYPNSPTAEFYNNSGHIAESELGEEDSHHHHHHPVPRTSYVLSNFGASATLGRNSGRFNRKSPFQILQPLAPTSPVCSTPQETDLPILSPLGTSSPSRNLPEFTTFGPPSSGMGPGTEISEESGESSGHIV